MYIEEKKQPTDNFERLGERRVLIADDAILFKLISSERAFRRRFHIDETPISSVESGMVDGEAVIIVFLNLPKGSSFSLDLPTRFEGYHVLIGYGAVEPF